MHEVSDIDGGDLYLWHLDAGEEPAPLIATAQYESDAALSPDGTGLAYVSNKSGIDEVYLTTFPPNGAERALSIGGGGQPIWSPDGSEVFYRQGDKFYVVAVRYRPELEVETPVLLFEQPYYTRASYYGSFYDVSQDGRRLLAVTDASTQEIHVVQNWFEELERLVPTD